MKGGGIQTIRTRFGLTVRLLIITAVLDLVAGPAFAELDQGPPLEVQGMKGKPARMQTALDGVMKEQEQLHQLLSQRPLPPPRAEEVVTHVSTPGNPMLGNPEAPLTLIEFSDYQCPYCRRFFETTLPALKTEYINMKRLRYVLRAFPLDRIYPQARKATKAAHCAREQGQYWAMQYLLFHHQHTLPVERLRAYARRLDSDAVAFDRCLEQGTYAGAVQNDVKEGTAAFFLGKTNVAGTI
jgi:protein-disulfide isomerase